MKVRYRDKVWEFDGRMTVRQVREQVDLIPEAALAVRDDQLLAEDTVLEKDEEVRFVAVISGG